MCVSFIIEIIHYHFFLAPPDVTARRNTIANALELVKVTKGKVGAYLGCYCAYFICLRLGHRISLSPVKRKRYELHWPNEAVYLVSVPRVCTGI